MDQLDPLFADGPPRLLPRQHLQLPRAGLGVAAARPQLVVHHRGMAHELGGPGREPAEDFQQPFEGGGVAEEVLDEAIGGLDPSRRSRPAISGDAFRTGRPVSLPRVTIASRTTAVRWEW